MLIHIGYHKTGTTFLQTGLFSSAAAGFVSPWLQPDIRRDIVLCSDFQWNASTVRQSFSAGRTTAEHSGIVPVMSDERLSGSPHAGGFDSARTARRLAEVFPDAKILIGIRKQADAIYSTFQQYVRNGGSAKIEKYFEPRHHAEIPQFRFEHWEYHHLVALYQELFSPERVLVLAHEQLRVNPQTWTEQIQTFVGKPAVSTDSGQRYPSLSPMGVEMKRHANRFLFRGALNPAAPLYVRNLESRFERLDHVWPASLSARVQRRNQSVVDQAVTGRYAQSNLQTAAITGLDLKALGYGMESQ